MADGNQSKRTDRDWPGVGEGNISNITRRGVLQAVGAGVAGAGFSSTDVVTAEGTTGAGTFTNQISGGESTADAVITDGSARFQIITPTLVRMEYARDGRFENRQTFHALDRAFGSPEYDTRVKDGWREIETDELLVRYERGSGPFTTENTEVELTVSGESITAYPDFGLDSVAIGSVIQAEAGTLSGGIAVQERADRNAQGDAYVGFDPNAYSVPVEVEWLVRDVPENGEYDVHFRYASDKEYNAVPADTPKELSLSVNGTAVTQLTFPSTEDWSDWQVLTETVSLTEGINTITIGQTEDDTGGLNLDSVAVTEPGSSMPTPDSGGDGDTTDSALGGWVRDLDKVSGSVDLKPGLLNENGWYLLDDSDTAVQTDSWVEPRRTDELYQDGYLFAYGRDYKRALSEFADLTGNASILPRWAFGNWFSRYYPYTVAEYEQDLIPTFRDNDVPLDVLVIDTDWKAPQQWNGWNWDDDLFPHPEQFLDWTKTEGLHTTLNVHPSIDTSDPRYGTATSIAGGSLPSGDGSSPHPNVWDWSKRSHAASYFSLHEMFDEQGNDFWWLDWCCDGSYVSMDGLTGDGWINSLYTQHLEGYGRRGFGFARIGASYQGYAADETSEAGPWAAHRNAVHFTGDTEATWEMLNFQTYMTHAEGSSIGLPYVTHDTGGFGAKHPPAELYARWVQSGTFQPILRLHSSHGDRLPWNYEEPARSVSADFLRLRTKLVPYLYTLAWQAHDEGLPMTRSMFLAYPNAEEAYEHDHQYLFGDQMLVAPIGEPGREEKGPCTVGSLCQAEDATLIGGTRTSTTHENYQGSSFVTGLDFEGIEWSVKRVDAVGEYDIHIRFANDEQNAGIPPETDRTLSLSVNGTETNRLTFPDTGTWDDWGTVTETVSLTKGASTIALRLDDDDTGNINVDSMAVTETGDAMPEYTETISPATKDVWFPEGTWYDFFTGERYRGPKTRTLDVPLERMPVFVKAGGIIPMENSGTNAGTETADPLILKVYPGSDGEFALYEDAGEGLDYDDGAYATTKITYEDSVEQHPGYAQGGSLLTIEGAEGSYSGQPTHRDYEVQFTNVDRPSWVRVHGKSVRETEPDSGEGWWYDGENRTLTVSIEQAATRANLTVSHGPLAYVQPSTTHATVGERIRFQVEDTSGSDRWITSLEWEFGDGASGTGWWNAHRYNTPGTYTVKVTATDNTGDTSTYTVPITVGEISEPIARIQPSTTDANVGERVTFQVEDTSGNDRWITSLEWEFGDGASGTGWWNAHRYGSSNTYTVKLTATDNTGHVTTDTASIDVS